MRFIVNFANPFPAQLFCKFLHIPIDGMLFKEVVERENTAFFHYTERFTDNQAFIGLGFYLMENKIVRAPEPQPMSSSLPLPFHESFESRYW